MIVGGCDDEGDDDELSTISDCWIHDLTTMKWKKVICVVQVYISDIVCLVLVFSYHSLIL